MPENIKEEAFEELDQVAKEHLMDDKQRNKALLKWAIRNSITYAGLAYCWNYTWVPYITVLALILTFSSLAMILFYNRIMEKKINNARKNIADL